MFLKYLDGLEQDRADEAALGNKQYSYILDEPYRWESWAAPKGNDGQIDLQILVDVNYPDRSATTILAGGSGE